MEIRGAPSLSDIFDQYITLKWRQGKVSGIWERKAKFVLHQTPKRSFGAPVSDVKFLDQKRSVGAPLIVTLRFWTKGSQLGPPVSSGGRLTSLEASLVRCFAFYKALGALFCKNNVQNIASLSKKCDVFTRWQILCWWSNQGDLIVINVGSLCSYIWACDKECFMI